MVYHAYWWDEGVLLKSIFEIRKRGGLGCRFHGPGS